MLIRTPESMHACCSLKKVQILDTVNLIDNSSCWNEHLMQIHPSSWITFGTRQMVHPQNHDCTNFTEKRFSQDSERKWIDGKIATHKFPPCSAGWVFAGLLQCPMFETVFFPSIPRGIGLKGCFNKELWMWGSEACAISLLKKEFMIRECAPCKSSEPHPKVVKKLYQDCWLEKIRTAKSYPSYSPGFSTYTMSGNPPTLGSDVHIGIYRWESREVITCPKSHS